MSTETSLFLPPNVFPTNTSYAASLISSNGSTSTLAIQCTAAGSNTSPNCGPTAPITIIVAPTIVEMTTVSTWRHTSVTYAETCTLAPARGTATCTVFAENGLYAPFHVDEAEYAANMLGFLWTTSIFESLVELTIHSLPVNITNVAAAKTIESTSDAKSSTGKSVFVFLAVCALVAAIGS